MTKMPKNLNTCPKEEIISFLGSFDNVLTDCDGVLWLGKTKINNTDKTINKFFELKKGVYYVTNNNTLSRSGFVNKCAKLGFMAKENNIICTSHLIAEYLKALEFTKKAYVIGSEGIIEEMILKSIKHTEIGPDILGSSLDTYMETKFGLDPDVGAVVLGFDPHFSYPKLLKAASYLKNPDCHFICACSDETFPTHFHNDIVFPGTGVLMNCLEIVSGRKAVVIGKPNKYVQDYVLKIINDPSRTLMIGDRCDTDILFGKECGFKTLLVLTGVTSLADVEKYSNSIKPNVNALVPDYYVEKLSDLLPYL